MICQINNLVLSIIYLKYMIPLKQYVMILNNKIIIHYY